MNDHRPFCQHWISHTLLVAMATDHAIGLLMISAARARLIARNRRLNSMPQPLDNRKSRSVWLSSERTDALKTNWAFLESMVLMVICERREQCVITRWTRFQHFSVMDEPCSWSSEIYQKRKKWRTSRCPLGISK